MFYRENLFQFFIIVIFSLNSLFVMPHKIKFYHENKDKSSYEFRYFVLPLLLGLLILGATLIKAKNEVV